MDIRIITQGGVLGNRGHRAWRLASCVSHGVAPPVPSLYVKWVLIPLSNTPI